VAETLTRKRPGVRQDSRGDDLPDWTSTTDATYTVRAIEPVSSTEDNDGRQAVITGLRVYLDSTADVAAGDRAVVRGTTYDVAGKPADWRSPFGTARGGLVVSLTATTG
jgi:hypothetical protein